ncbi:MAG: hypothetical protein NXI04_06605 [Planctomycetaceae bacterium]|nr:hypothetical protein [Planctomycetaceae bacterium]
MKTVFAGTMLFVLTSTSTASEGLFELLDANGDGVVTAEEISPAQRPYFVRALRVSDRNEDGALTRAELQTATTDPQRTQIATGQNRLRNAGSFDPARFDANKDGKLAKTEIPVYLRSRMAPLYERFGTEEIAIADLKRVLSYTSGTSGKSAGNNKQATRNEKDMSDKDSMSMRRANDRQPSSQPAGREAGSRMEQFRQQMQQRQQGRRPAGRSPAGGSSAETFKRMDRDGDGKLSGREIPERMKNAMRRFDRNSDQALSEAEFKAMAENYRRQLGGK